MGETSSFKGDFEGVVGMECVLMRFEALDGDPAMKSPSPKPPASPPLDFAGEATLPKLCVLSSIRLNSPPLARLDCPPSPLLSASVEVFRRVSAGDRAGDTGANRAERSRGEE